jgi:hypothetical protein
MNMAQAFNEWMRRYIEEPERFAREWQTVEEFKADESAGIEPDYGATCEAYLRGLMGEKRIDEPTPFTTADIEAMRGKPKLSPRITDYAGTKKHVGYAKPVPRPPDPRTAKRKGGRKGKR